MNIIPESYKKQTGCYNCKFCFIHTEYDEDSRYYCHIDKSSRPICGSVHMDEHFHTKSQDDITTSMMYDKWDNWCKDREVRAWGVCDKHELL